ncbi:zonular occludens toxin domain-containing protein [Acinetobacter variabilis]|uniref:zonular occludens toxin domain-containing protein n=1 Tax=Acinetobacter variabilis TaxID=70346 RepID=UPI0028A1B9F7|nr:zonular occludens toxin domain-containing protein [Acinetobacter variabilis]
MAIYMIVGQPRHGKSQFSVKMAYDYHLKNLEIQKRIDSGKFDPEKDIVREIYSDINGHAEKCDFIKPAPADWRDVPNNSIIFMDEIHKRPEYEDNGQMSQNPMIKDLRTHGHQNKDIILITQDPQTLNKAIRMLIEKMHLVKRPIQKPNFATIYEFERWLRDPWQAAASERSVKYQDSYKFFYKKKWQDMYTSASAHTSINFKIQSKFIYAIIAIIVLMSAAYFLFTKSGGDKLARNAVSGMTGKKAEQETKPTENNNASSTTATSDFNADIECRKGANVEKPECVKWFNDLSKNGTSVTSTGTVQAVSYNPNKPYDFEYQPQVQPTDFPRMSGVIQLSSGRLMAIDQQGNYMQGVSEADCKKWLSGYRPFNYFAQNRQEQRERSVPEQTQANSETSSL